MQTQNYLSSVIVSCLLLTLGCGGGGAMSEIDDEALRLKNEDCEMNPPSTPGRGTACENIREECERRAKEKGPIC